MSHHLSVDAIRREIGMSRDVLARLHKEETNWREAIEAIEASLADKKTALEQVQAKIGHEERVVEALTQAAAVLAERLPTPVPQVPVAASAADPGEAEERAAMVYALQKAQEIDLTEVPQHVWDRLDLIAMLLVDHGPQRQYQLARHLEDVVDGITPRAAQSTVSEGMPVLIRQGRVRPVDDGASRYVTWEAVPPERASAGMGVDVDAYAGTTTRWPVDSEKPAKGSRISVESTAFEAGKDR